MEDLGQNLGSPLLVELLKQRDSAMTQLTDLNNKLAAAKVTKRGGIRKAIRNVEQAMKNIDKAIDKERNDLIRLENKKTNQILAEQGIDSRAALFGGISDITAQGANIAGAIVGKGGVSSVGVARADRDKAIGVEQSKTDATKGMSKNVIYGVIAVVVLFILMKKK